MSTTSTVTTDASRRAKAKTSFDFQALPVRTLDIGHSRIAYRTLGNGPDLVFIHGWPLDMNTYRELAPLLASSFCCHLFDLPGAGATKTNDASFVRLEQHFTTARTVIDALGLQRYAILAHDSGGMIARVVAANDPRVTGLVLGNTEVPHYHSPVLRIIKAALNTPLGAPILRTMLRVRALRRSPLGFAGCFQDRDLLDGEFYELFLAPLLADPARARLQTELLRTLQDGLVDELPSIHARIQCPTKLIWGSDDPFFPLARARAMVPEFVAGADLDVIDGGKLFVHEERPQTFADLARPFLLRAFGRSRTVAAE